MPVQWRGLSGFLEQTISEDIDLCALIAQGGVPDSLSGEKLSEDHSERKDIAEGSFAPLRINCSSAR